MTLAAAACSSPAIQPLPDPTYDVCATSACASPSATGAGTTSSTTSGGQTYGGQLAGGSISEEAWDGVVARVLDSVLLVENTGCGFTATGSGFVASRRTVVTNRHVVEDARTLSVRTRDGRRIPVTSWEVSATDDLAVVHVAGDLPVGLPRRASDPVPGDLVVAIGYPLSGPQKVTRGRVVEFEDRPEGSTEAHVLRTTAAVLPGNSGGPLVDTNGVVSGVVFAIDLVEGDTLVLPVSRLAKLLAGQSRRPGRPCRG